MKINFFDRLLWYILVSINWIYTEGWSKKEGKLRIVAEEETCSKERKQHRRRAYSHAFTAIETVTPV